VFYWNRHAVYWHGATYDTYFDYRPNVAVHTEAIRDAVAREYAYYDFNPSGSLEGVIEFKRRFGAEQRPFVRWKYGDEKFAHVRMVRQHLGMLASAIGRNGASY
jgi:lipid II:glycine glycyltransferase (peptidoglycan interpeptide bridge formation enzyme)